ncbi:hypothetical protein [Glycomyces paridis]|uniref:Uncharacterized protein n=1 Tax=Glycomyces paridis TaxID=2126555 RepID=A0A4S8PDS0_9ACTN|nr:hypothetical protein [Glycomyces paridis]THV26464.1 hypothetical protein E9998_18055 [Glycomyces paridis]
MSGHDFLCTGWDPVELDTYRDEQLEMSEARIVVFDPLGRVDPDFDDPSALRGAALLSLAVLLFAGAAVARLFIVDDGTVARGIVTAFGRVRRRLVG